MDDLATKMAQVATRPPPQAAHHPRLQDALSCSGGLPPVPPTAPGLVHTAGSSPAPFSPYPSPIPPFAAASPMPPLQHHANPMPTAASPMRGSCFGRQVGAAAQILDLGMGSFEMDWNHPTSVLWDWDWDWENLPPIGANGSENPRMTAVPQAEAKFAGLESTRHESVHSSKSSVSTSTDSSPKDSLPSDTSAVTPPPVSAKKTKTARNTKKSYCRVEGCKIDLSSAKKCHRKRRVCEHHSKAPKVVIAGLERRFCQQCSRFHRLAEFDPEKKSRRKCLNDHNARRRKPQP